MWGCFLMSGVKILHFLKDWWKSIPIHQHYTMALTPKNINFHFRHVPKLSIGFNIKFGQNHEKGMKNTVNSPQVELA